ncbi:restriction endonuclease [Pararhodospirillum photometricum]|uniref:restriction endonuclease n=1 Tax=Pararhodospirillum photometricum TaxID=1084 RepID=UPI003BB7AE42
MKVAHVFLGKHVIIGSGSVILPGENEALKGYIVTTSYFSTPAQASAAKSDRVVLVDGDELIRWHREERVTR